MSMKTNYNGFQKSVCAAGVVDREAQRSKLPQFVVFPGLLFLYAMKVQEGRYFEEGEETDRAI